MAVHVLDIDGGESLRLAWYYKGWVFNPQRYVQVVSSCKRGVAYVWTVFVKDYIAAISAGVFGDLLLDVS